MRRRGRTIRIRWWVWVSLLVAGLAAVAAGLGWLLVVLLAMSWFAVMMFNRAVPMVGRLHDEVGTEDPQPRALLAQPRNRLDAVLGDVPSSTLCRLWEQTSQDLRRTYLPSTVCSYAELRAAILDELTRRHPDGVRRWLGDQPYRRDLSSYLQHHP